MLSIAFCTNADEPCPIFSTIQTQFETKVNKLKRDVLIRLLMRFQRYLQDKRVDTLQAKSSFQDVVGIHKSYQHVKGSKLFS